MDQFRTIISAQEFPFSINHSTDVMMIGSCFAENIGERLLQNKLKAVINPFGILFNPFSIMNSMERMLNDRPYEAEELVQVAENYVSLDHHGRFSRATAQQTLDEINVALTTGRVAILRSKVIFITLGSAWVHRYLASGRIVANCHKIAAAQFRKELLSMEDCHLILRHIPQFLTSYGVDAQVVFTVSPVRHWKDGAIQNQRSKAQLIAAVHQVVDEFENCHYFPGYEIMMDDLRDYRFYATDMLHPTPQAVDYIWEKFQESFFNDETRIICKEVQGVMQAANHRPVDPESNSYQRFIDRQLKLIEEISKRYPNVNLESERFHFSALKLS
ncbi:MAG: GSCFA domain-containing protein [Flavobacteriales bacterium]